MNTKEKDEIQINLVDQLHKITEVQTALLKILQKLENENSHSKE